jgi:hypothetical protein
LRTEATVTVESFAVTAADTFVASSPVTAVSFDAGGPLWVPLSWSVRPDEVEPFVAVVLPVDAVVDGALGVAVASAEATLATPATSAPPNATPTALPTSHFFVFTGVIRVFSFHQPGAGRPWG